MLAVFLFCLELGLDKEVRNHVQNDFHQISMRSMMMSTKTSMLNSIGKPYGDQIEEYEYAHEQVYDDVHDVDNAVFDDYHVDVLWC